MQKPELPYNDEARINALHKYSVLDTLPEKDFNDITKIASQICDTPISTITLIDKDRQWFKSKVGIENNETSRDFSFCAHSINKPDEILVIPDSRKDDRFFDNPLVVEKPGVIFYAGVPLVNTEGFALGTLCIIDNKPKEITQHQLDLLKSLSHYVVNLLDLRKKNIELSKTRIILQRTLEMHNQSQKVAKVGGWEFDLVENKVTWSDETRLIHEVPENYDPHLQTGINFYKKGKSRDTITKLVEQAIEKGIPFDVELQLITAKENEIWVRLKGETEFVNGKCVRLFGILQDINEYKIKDLKLAQSEEQFRQTFFYSATGIAIINLEGKWEKANERLCKIVGYTEQELKQMNFADITHADDIEKEMKLFNQLLNKEIPSYEIEKRYIHKNGYPVWVTRILSVVKSEENEPMHFVSQVMDISERIAAEQAAKEERKLMRTVIDNIPVNIFIKDLQSRKILANRKELEYVGAKEEADVLHKNDFELYPEESAKISIAEDNDVFNTGISILNKETLNERQDGKKNWFLTSKIPLVGDDNKITGLLGISYDINERKESEKKMKLLMDVTSEQNARLLNFAHIVSHNLRSHSSNFIMLVDFIQKEKNEAERQNLIDLLRSATESLRETVDNLNEVVMVNFDAKKKTESINLFWAIQKVQDNIRGLMIAQSAKCINEVEKNIKIKAVPAYLDSILLNFFTNSIKYKSPKRKPVITLSTTIENDFVVLTFRDNGIGIDMNRNGDKLFGMYKTFHGNKDARGVGLFITKNQIEAMGGKIIAESVLDEGTTFKIFFYEQQN